MPPNSPARRWRLLRAIAPFTAGFFLAWAYRSSLLVWITEPYVNATERVCPIGPPTLHYYQPPSPQLFYSYLWLTGTGGMLATAPQLGSWLIRRFTRRGLAERLQLRISAVLLGAASAALGVRFAHSLLPFVLERWLPPARQCHYPPALFEFVSMACMTVVAVALSVELCTIGVVLGVLRVAQSTSSS